LKTWALSSKSETPTRDAFGHEYRRSAATRMLLLAAGVALLAALAVLAVTVGAVKVPLGDACRVLMSALWTPWRHATSSLSRAVIWELRLPRIALAVVAGAGLALSGAVIQTTARNPLASPFTLGISAAAGFGAALAIVLGAGLGGPGRWLVVANAFACSVAAMALVHLLGAVKGFSPSATVLSGIAVNFFFMALTSLLQYLGQSEDVKAVVLWLMGGLHRATWGQAGLLGAVLLVALVLLWAIAWDLNALQLGDEVAHSLGVPHRRLRLWASLVALLVTATVISFTGTIGFVCLVGPHMARLMVGPDHRFLLPASCLMGGLLLLGADTVARTMVAPLELPVGIVTSLLGVPIFVYLLLRGNTGYWGV